MLWLKDKQNASLSLRKSLLNNDNNGLYRSLVLTSNNKKQRIRINTSFKERKNDLIEKWAKGINW